MVCNSPFNTHFLWSCDLLTIDPTQRRNRIEALPRASVSSSGMGRLDQLLYTECMLQRDYKCNLFVVVVQSLSCVNSLRPHGLHKAGFPVLHHLPELAQTHVHPVSDATQPSDLLSSPSPPAFNLSQHQGLFQRVSSSHQVAKVLELQVQHQYFQ